MEFIRTFCICHTIGLGDADKGMENLCQTSFSSPSDMAATDRGWRVCAKQARSLHSFWQHPGRDTIACSDGKGCLYLISLSSRRRGRCIAQMPPVKAGGWDCLLLPNVQFYFISGQHKNRAPKSPVFAISFSFATNQNPTGRFFTPYTQPLHLRWCSAPRREVSCR